MTERNQPLVPAPRKAKGQFRLAVNGSRTLKDERVKILLLEAIAEHGVTALVTHAEPDGACRVARDLAKEIAMPLHLHFLDFAKKRGAWEHRGKAVLRDADHGIFIHDGVSKGTSNELAMAVRLGLPYTLHTLTRAKGPSQSFEDDDDWSGALG